LMREKGKFAQVIEHLKAHHVLTECVDALHSHASANSIRYFLH
jgi:hypothetical protein